jgi:hypothetical protein
MSVEAAELEIRNFAAAAAAAAAILVGSNNSFFCEWQSPVKCCP